MKRLLTATLALSLLAGTAASAQPYGQRQDDRRDNNNGGYQQNRHDNGNHYGQQKHRWARGERLDRTYYSDRSRYVDYRRHHLRAPPRGYQWVQVDNNYALVALTSGLIASIIASR
ncbi:MAG: putative secreted protein [Phenylobacterium sp.]|jgi:Ni/Co efflux regulator RcnB|nr:putative secreted protein [Phenylobacterium sp.]